MLVGAYDLNIGHFYEIENDENDRREKAILTDIKLNTIGFYGTFLTFNGYYKTKDIEADSIVPIDYINISENELLDMIEAIATNISIYESLDVDEEIALMKRIIIRFLYSRKIGE